MTPRSASAGWTNAWMIAVSAYASLNVVGWLMLQSRDWTSLSGQVTTDVYFASLFEWAGQCRWHIAISALAALVAIPIAILLRRKVQGWRLGIGLFVVGGLAVASFMTLAWDAFGMGV